MVEVGIKANGTQSTRQDTQKGKLKRTVVMTWFLYYLSCKIVPSFFGSVCPKSVQYSKNPRIRAYNSIWHQPGLVLN